MSLGASFRQYLCQRYDPENRYGWGAGFFDLTSHIMSNYRVSAKTGEYTPAAKKFQTAKLSFILGPDSVHPARP